MKEALGNQGTQYCNHGMRTEQGRGRAPKEHHEHVAQVGLLVVVTDDGTKVPDDQVHVVDRQIVRVDELPHSHPKKNKHKGVPHHELGAGIL